jgi:hypothetical protein
MRYFDIINETSGHRASQTRARVADQITRWFAAHNIVSKDNLASPLAIRLPEHLEAIWIDVREWPDGQVTSLTQMKTLRPEFEEFLRPLGWHITAVSPSNWTDFGTVMRLRLAPNYPTKTVAVPRILTHSTRARNLASILRVGLQPDFSGVAQSPCGGPASPVCNRRVADWRRHRAR